MYKKAECYPYAGFFLLIVQTLHCPFFPRPYYVVGSPFPIYLTCKEYSCSVVFVTFPFNLPCREYSDGRRWSSFQHRRMSNATPPAGDDLFSTAPCNFNWHCFCWSVVWRLSNRRRLVFDHESRGGPLSVMEEDGRTKSMCLILDRKENQFSKVIYWNSWLSRHTKLL